MRKCETTNSTGAWDGNTTKPCLGTASDGIVDEKIYLRPLFGDKVTTKYLYEDCVMEVWTEILGCFAGVSRTATPWKAAEVEDAEESEESMQGGSHLINSWDINIVTTIFLSLAMVKKNRRNLEVVFIACNWLIFWWSVIYYHYLWNEIRMNFHLYLLGREMENFSLLGSLPNSNATINAC